MTRKSEQRIGRKRENRREYTKEEMERWYKAVEECAKSGTERMRKLEKKI